MARAARRMALPAPVLTRTAPRGPSPSEGEPPGGPGMVGGRGEGQAPGAAACTPEVARPLTGNSARGVRLPTPPGAKRASVPPSPCCTGQGADHPRPAGQGDPRHPLRPPPGGAHLGLPEAEGLAVAGEDEVLPLAVGQAGADHRVPRGQLEVQHPRLARAPVLLQERLLDSAPAL